MPTLRIQRPYQYVNSLRSYRLFVDGTQVAIVGSVRTVDVPISPGAHTITARIDWCSSNPLPLDCADGEVCAVEVGCSLRGWRLLLALLYLTVLRRRYLYVRLAWRLEGL